MWIKSNERDPVLLKFIVDKYKSQEIYEKAVKGKGWTLRFVPSYLKICKMYKKTVEEDPYTLKLY